MVYLNDLNELAKQYSGNDNPTVWIKDDLVKDNSKCIPPSNVFVDDDGDIIIEVPVDYMSENR